MASRIEPSDYLATGGWCFPKLSLLRIWGSSWTHRICLKCRWQPWPGKLSLSFLFHSQVPPSIIFSNPVFSLYYCQYGPVPIASTFSPYDQYFLIIPTSQPNLLLREINFLSQISFSADFFFPSQLLTSKASFFRLLFQSLPPFNFLVSRQNSLF